MLLLQVGPSERIFKDCPSSDPRGVGGAGASVGVGEGDKEVPPSHKTSDKVPGDPHFCRKSSGHAKRPVSLALPRQEDTRTVGVRPMSLVFPVLSNTSSGESDNNDNKWDPHNNQDNNISDKNVSYNPTAIYNNLPTGSESLRSPITRPTSLKVVRDNEGSLLQSLKKNSPVEALQERYLSRITPTNTPTPGRSDVHFIAVEVERAPDAAKGNSVQQDAIWNDQQDSTSHTDYIYKQVTPRNSDNKIKVNESVNVPTNLESKSYTDNKNYGHELDNNGSHKILHPKTKVTQNPACITPVTSTTGVFDSDNATVRVTDSLNSGDGIEVERSSGAKSQAFNNSSFSPNYSPSPVSTPITPGWCSSKNTEPSQNLKTFPFTNQNTNQTSVKPPFLSNSPFIPSPNQPSYESDSKPAVSSVPGLSPFNSQFNQNSSHPSDTIDNHSPKSSNEGFFKIKNLRHISDKSPDSNKSQNLPDISAKDIQNLSNEDLITHANRIIEQTRLLTSGDINNLNSPSTPGKEILYDKSKLNIDVVTSTLENQGNSFLRQSPESNILQESDSSSKVSSNVGVVTGHPSLPIYGANQNIISSSAPPTHNTQRDSTEEPKLDDEFKLTSRQQQQPVNFYKQVLRPSSQEGCVFPQQASSEAVKETPVSYSQDLKKKGSLSPLKISPTSNREPDASKYLLEGIYNRPLSEILSQRPLAELNKNRPLSDIFTDKTDYQETNSSSLPTSSKSSPSTHLPPSGFNLRNLSDKNSKFQSSSQRNTNIYDIISPVDTDKYVSSSETPPADTGADKTPPYVVTSPRPIVVSPSSSPTEETISNDSIVIEPVVEDVFDVTCDEVRPTTVVSPEIQNSDVMGGERRVGHEVWRPRGHCTASAAIHHSAPQRSHHTSGCDVPSSPPHKDMGGISSKKRTGGSTQLTATHGTANLNKPITPLSSPRGSAKLRDKPPEDASLPPYVRQRGEPAKRYSGFGHVNSDNVRRMRDIWGSKQEPSPTSVPKSPKFPPSGNSRRNSGTNSPLDSPISPRRRSTASPSREPRSSPVRREASPTSKYTSNYREQSPYRSNYSTSGKQEYPSSHRNSSPSQYKSNRNQSASPSRPPFNHQSQSPLRHNKDSSIFSHQSSPPSKVSRDSPIHRHQSPSPSRQRESPLRNAYSSPSRQPHSSTITSTTSSSRPSSKYEPSHQKRQAPARPETKSPPRTTSSSSSKSSDEHNSSRRHSAWTDQPSKDKYSLGEAPGKGAGTQKRATKTPSPPSSASRVHQRLFTQLRDSSLRPDSDAICFVEEENRFKVSHNKKIIIIKKLI